MIRARACVTLALFALISCGQARQAEPPAADQGSESSYQQSESQGPTALEALGRASAAAKAWREDATAAGILEFFELDRRGCAKAAVIWTFCSRMAGNLEPDRMPRDEAGRPLYHNQLKVSVDGATVSSIEAAGSPEEAAEDVSEVGIDSDGAVARAIETGGGAFLDQHKNARIEARLLSASAMALYLWPQQDAAAAGEPYERAVPKAVEALGLPPHWIWCVRLTDPEPFARLEIFIDAVTGEIVDRQLSLVSPTNYIDQP